MQQILDSNISQEVKNLYSQDYVAWCEETANILKNGDYNSLDVENLIEEILGLASRDRREVRSRLIVLLSHLLKRQYVSNPQDLRGWDLTIIEQKDELNHLLQQSPSLRPYLGQVFDETWNRALSRTQVEYPKTIFPLDFPFAAPFDLILSDRPWETLTNETI